MESVRIDKYLWACRVFKTRSLATDECRKSHILINDISVKPSRMIKKGELIIIKFPPILRSFEVLDLIERRVSAKLALDYIKEITPESEFVKLKEAKNTYVHRDNGLGRPTKKERRLIDKFKQDEL